MKTTRKSPADRAAALFRPNDPSSSFSIQPPYNDSDVDNSGNALDLSVSTQTNLSFIDKPIFLESPVNYDFAIDHEYSQANQDDAGVLDLINLTKKVEELSFKVAELDNELTIAKKAFFLRKNYKKTTQRSSSTPVSLLILHLWLPLSILSQKLNI